MSGKKITLGQKGSGNIFKPILTIILMLLLISLVSACSAPAGTTLIPTSNASGTPTTAPATTTAATPKPQGELFGGLQSFGNENFLPWADPGNASLIDLVYDMLIYWDGFNRKFIPGLAESWEVSPDAMILTYNLRKGVQWQDGWGEFTSADVKYYFEMQASPKSVGKAAQCRRIASMDTPDPYTLVVHFKDPYPTFFMDLSLMVGATCQGIVCKKYVETVGEEVASQKPIGSGPYRLVDSKAGSYFKFEALDNHWRVVPEFKTLTLRLMSEVSTIVAALKNKEIDAAINVPAEQIVDLKAAGVATEASPVGGFIMIVNWGGMVIPADTRYDANIHNKDPWIDPKVRKAMAISIDREAICKAIYAGYAEPSSVPLSTTDMGKYQYSYDPATARQLLKDAGYPNGFSFKAISYKMPGTSEMPRLLEALAAYWQQIGLDPKITVIDYDTYNSKNFMTAKTAGNISLWRNGVSGDMLTKAESILFPNGMQVGFQDEGSYAIYKDSPKATVEERSELVNKLNQYYYDNVGPIPVVRAGYCFAWNSDKILPWPHGDGSQPTYYEYVRHAKPLNTFRLFTPFPGR